MANIIELLGTMRGLEPLGIVYAVLAVSYIASQPILRKLEACQPYTLSNCKGHSVKVTLDPSASAEERMCTVQEKLQVLASQPVGSDTAASQ